jgi:basic membrane protein A
MKFIRVIKYLVSTLCFCVLTTKTAAAQKIGLVLDRGGKDDKSFNSAAYAGALKSQKELGIEFKYVEATDQASLENLHRTFAKRNFDLVIGVGFAQADAVAKVAAQFPKTQFAIVDAEVKAPNVKSLMFMEHEGSFLAGALAAKKSQTGQIGFIGGMDIPLIRRFEMGYQAGAKFVNPKIKVLTQYVGLTGAAWNNPNKAKELALAQFNQKTDIIFAAAGASGSGVFEAAVETKKLAIGVDSNQNWIKPGFILTSMQKRVDVAVFETISEVKNKKFAAGRFDYGLKNKGIALAFDEHNKSLVSQSDQKMIDDLSAKIVSGTIKVPDYYLNKGL